MPTPHFATVHAEWLRARAAVAHFDVLDQDNVSDEMIAAINAHIAAEWKLIQTPASDLNDIRLRAQVVLDIFARADVNGEPTDTRHRLMLAALVSEILKYPPPAR